MAMKRTDITVDLRQISRERARELVRAALELVRRETDDTWVSLQSDRPWPAQVHRALTALRELRSNMQAAGHLHNRDRACSGLSVDIDNPFQFDLLAAIAPFARHAEGWMGRRQTFSINDSGSILWLSLAEDKLEDWDRIIGDLGLPPRQHEDS